jgi:hypothetical protein
VTGRSKSEAYYCKMELCSSAGERSTKREAWEPGEAGNESIVGVKRKLYSWFVARAGFLRHYLFFFINNRVLGV